ncbi:MAG TPA: substrate-binding domain-containing protein [Methylococcaceae bacterium]|nr:substrate-binding domain-containing protein [Methylococcaceae bacterium]
MGRFPSLGRVSLLAFALLASGPASPAGREADDFVVIVTRDTPLTPLDKETLARIFLRKKIFWDNGTAIAPVNLSASHPLRRLFSEQILGLDPEELDDYWNAQYFHGIFPPYVVASEEAMLRFVAQSPGAIGYVSACAVDQRVKALLWPPSANPARDPPRICPQK